MAEGGLVGGARTESGLIEGQGSGKSDSNVIMASKGEFVVRADGGNLDEAVAHFGFADGGPIDEYHHRRRRHRRHRRHLRASTAPRALLSHDPTGLPYDPQHPDTTGYHYPGTPSGSSLGPAEESFLGAHPAPLKAQGEAALHRWQRQWIDAQNIDKYAAAFPERGTPTTAGPHEQEVLEDPRFHPRGPRGGVLGAPGQRPHDSPEFQRAWKKALFEDKYGPASGRMIMRRNPKTGQIEDVRPVTSAYEHAGGGTVGDSTMIKVSKGEFIVAADGSNLHQAVAHFTRGFASGGLIGGFVRSMAVPSHAGGGLVTLPGQQRPAELHQLDLRTDAGTVRVAIAPDAMRAVEASSLATKLTRIGTTPSWYG